MKPRRNPRESTIVRQIVAALRTIPGVVVRKRHGSSWSVAGDPDLYGSYKGRHFEIEVKRPSGEVSEIQQARLRDWERAGALVGVARGVEDALVVLGISEAGN